jgi:hypothetical protein
MQRDIMVDSLAEVVEVCALLTERGHGFEVVRYPHGWRIRLTGAF